MGAEKTTMVNQVSCKEAGYEECDFLIQSENQDELIVFVREHAEGTHELDLSQSDVEGLIQDV